MIKICKNIESSCKKYDSLIIFTWKNYDKKKKYKEILQHTDISIEELSNYLDKLYDFELVAE